MCENYRDVNGRWKQCSACSSGSHPIKRYSNERNWRSSARITIGIRKLLDGVGSSLLGEWAVFIAGLQGSHWRLCGSNVFFCLFGQVIIRGGGFIGRG